MNGWIKLHRTAVEHEIFQDDKAFKVFIWLLATVDRKTGSIRVGRFWMSEVLRMNPNTLVSVLKRLEKKYEIINITSNNRFSTISLINWSRYQVSDNSSTQPSTTNQQQINTLQELRIKNREEENTEEEISEKIPNRLVVSKSQYSAYKKEFEGISLEELKQQREECNQYMAMSSENYKNPGIFFKKWLTKYWRAEQAKRAQAEEEKRQREQMEYFYSPEQININKERLLQIKREAIG